MPLLCFPFVFYSACRPGTSSFLSLKASRADGAVMSLWEVTEVNEPNREDDLSLSRNKRLRILFLHRHYTSVFR